MVNRLGPNIHGEPLCAAKEEKQVSNMGTFPLTLSFHIVTC